ncbi:MAG TPA: heme o synthase [Patescibacteria group bacterium]|nr:heme o synthase [Patescibacteria group bacterium]
MAASSLVRPYYELIKPERTLANGLTTLAGFLLAANGHINFALLAETLIGVCLVVASACAFNNYYDRDIDSAMQRTKGRVLVKGEIPPLAAVAYAAILGLAGFVVLGVYTNWPTVLTGIVGMVDYLLLYGPAKRRTVYSTLIGTICGATPIVAGYTAVTGMFDLGALLLFLIMVSWQMAHFYAIGVYRRKDYAAAGLPIWPVKNGVASTKRQIVFFIAVFIVITARLTLSGYAGLVYLVVSVGLGLAWLYKGLRGVRAADSDKWARGMFGFSLVVLLGFSTAMALNAWIP